MNAFIPIGCVLAFVILLVAFACWMDRQLQRYEADDAATNAEAVQFLADLRDMPDPDWSQPCRSLPVEHCGLVPLTADEWDRMYAEPYGFDAHTADALRVVADLSNVAQFPTQRGAGDES